MTWAWNLDGGWLRSLGFFDRGGSVVIFHIGSLAGIIGVIILGPRYGRYLRRKEKEKILAATAPTFPLSAQLEEKLSETLELDEMFLRRVRSLIYKETQLNDFYAINVPMMVFGTFLCVIGWVMLNSAGAGKHSLNSYSGRFTSEVAYINTFLSGSFSGLISFVLKRYVVRGDNKRTPRYDVKSLCNGFLSGVAAVSAGSGIMYPWSAIVTGSIQAFAYMITCWLFKKVRFDDPMENF